MTAWSTSCWLLIRPSKRWSRRQRRDLASPSAGRRVDDIERWAVRKSLRPLTPAVHMSNDTPNRGADPATGQVEHIQIVPGYCGGKPHIVGHRIKVQHIALWHERAGMSRDEIAMTYGLSLSQ